MMHPIVPAVAAREHAVPGEKAPRGWLALDDEQRLDAAQRECGVGGDDLDARIIDVDSNMHGHLAMRNRQAQPGPHRDDPAIRCGPPTIVECLDSNPRKHGDG